MFVLPRRFEDYNTTHVKQHAYTYITLLHYNTHVNIYSACL